MKLKELLEQLNELAKERPEALEMELRVGGDSDYGDMSLEIKDEEWNCIKEIQL